MVCKVGMMLQKCIFTQLPQQMSTHSKALVELIILVYHSLKSVAVLRDGAQSKYGWSWVESRNRPLNGIRVLVVDQA